MTEWLCWHCDNTHSCTCMFCLVEDINGRHPGPCQACKGHKRFEAIRPYLEANNINPGEARWWTFDKDGKRVFIPHQLLALSQKEKNS